ncbi:MAG: hypothetical protein DBY32_10795 [Phascolarctobacterium sp.]|nr:MAG: hypothetical protein DBY32_10795 [Phascolarctobacterium sp.]
MMNSKKLCATILCAAFLMNNTCFSLAFANEASYEQISIDEEYDPFADEEVQKEPEKLTMKQRVAKLMEEEKNKNKIQVIQGVENGHIYIPKGTKLNVELLEAASSKKLKKNQLVEFKMVENLIINGVIVIPKDTIGIGYVYEVQKAGGFGRKGVLRIAGKEIKTINNITVPLKKGLEGKGKTDGGAVAVAAAVSLVGGLFMKGTNIEYPAGTNFEVEVRNNVDLQTTPGNLKEAMNPNVPHGIELNIQVK